MAYTYIYYAWPIYFE